MPCATILPRRAPRINLQRRCWAIRQLDGRVESQVAALLVRRDAVGQRVEINRRRLAPAAVDGAAHTECSKHREADQDACRTAAATHDTRSVIRANRPSARQRGLFLLRPTICSAAAKLETVEKRSFEIKLGFLGVARRMVAAGPVHLDGVVVALDGHAIGLRETRQGHAILVDELDEQTTFAETGLGRNALVNIEEGVGLGVPAERDIRQLRPGPVYAVVAFKQANPPIRAVVRLDYRRLRGSSSYRWTAYGTE